MQMVRFSHLKWGLNRDNVAWGCPTVFECPTKYGKQTASIYIFINLHNYFQKGLLNTRISYSFILFSERYFTTQFELFKNLMLPFFIDHEKKNKIEENCLQIFCCRFHI